MTPRLIPYTLFRRFVPGLLGGAACLIGWWLSLQLLSLHHLWRKDWRVTPLWSPETEGAFVLGMIAAFATLAQLLVQGRFERTPLRRRIVVAWWGAMWALGGTMLFSAGYHALFSWRTAFPDWPRMPEGTLAIRWRMWPWVFAGGWTMFSLLWVRLARWFFNLIQQRWNFSLIDPPPPPRESPALTITIHLLAGPAAGALAAVVWYTMGQWLDDLYLPTVAGAWVFGFATMTFGWAIPEDLFQGWIVVRNGARPGWRVPLDAGTPELAERFVGSFPAGLDLHLPASDGVDLLHLSVLAPGPGEWAARGLSQRTVRVVRPFERIDLAFDPSLPAPLETPLRHEDRVRLGHTTELELVVVPSEGLP